MKTFTLIRTMALAGLIAFALNGWGQGLETFENHPITGTTYVDGNYIGDNGITWYYVHCTGEQAYPIDNKGILLRRSEVPSKVYSSVIPGGIGNFSVQMRKAFTGTGDRQVALYVNDTWIANSQTFGGASGADETIHLFEVNNINIEGNIVIEIRHITGGSNNRQLVIDNLTWTAYGDAPIPPTITNIQHFPDTDITSSTTVSVSADVSEGDAPIDHVELRWGTASGEYPNTITMLSLIHI